MIQASNIWYHPGSLPAGIYPGLIFLLAFSSSSDSASEASQIPASPDGFYPSLFLFLPSLLSFHPPWCWQSGTAGCHVGSNLMSRGIKGTSEYGMLPGAPGLDSPLFGAGRCRTLQAKDQKTSCPLSASCHQGPGCSWAYGQDVIYLLIAQGSLAPAPISMEDSRVPGEASPARQLTRCPGQEVDGSIPECTSHVAEEESRGMKELEASTAVGLGKHIAPVSTADVPVGAGAPCPK